MCADGMVDSSPGDTIGIASLDDVKFLDMDLLTEAGIKPIHRKKIMAWIEAQQQKE